MPLSRGKVVREDSVGVSDDDFGLPIDACSWVVFGKVESPSADTALLTATLLVDQDINDNDNDNNKNDSD